MERIETQQDYVVCVKPVGISSEDGPDSMPALLRQELGGEIFPVHRLDLNVGGLMVYARTKAAAARLSQALQEGTMVKEYLAVLHGIPEASEGCYEDLLWKDSSKNKVFVVKRSRKGVKAAKLTYRCMETSDNITLVHIRLHTGRSHQIRVQFASRRTPLLGDHKYGSRDDAKSPALWSTRITFPHPRTGKLLTFSCLPTGEVWDTFQSPHLTDLP